MQKYIAVKVSGIITQIALLTAIKGYTEGVIEAFLPDENESINERKWIAENNKRMTAICKFLNDNNL